MSLERNSLVRGIYTPLEFFLLNQGKQTLPHKKA